MKVTILTLGSRGDVEPCVALALGLARAGHEATLATGTDFEGFVAGRGVRYAPMRVNVRVILRSEKGKKLLAGRGVLDRLRPIPAEAWALRRRLMDDAWAAAQEPMRSSTIRASRRLRRRREIADSGASGGPRGPAVSLAPGPRPERGGIRQSPGLWHCTAGGNPLCGNAKPLASANARPAVAPLVCRRPGAERPADAGPLSVQPPRPSPRGGLARESGGDRVLVSRPPPRLASVRGAGGLSGDGSSPRFRRLRQHGQPGSPTGDGDRY